MKTIDSALVWFRRDLRADGAAEVDAEQSGNYLIKEVRHHFEGNQMVSSLKLVRDSYGLYGAKQ